MSETGFNQLDQPRIFEARRAVADVMPKVSPVRRLGLVIYGPGPRDACSNIDVRFGPTADAGPRVIADIEALTPSGNTPLSASVATAAEVLGYRDRPGVVVVVTDGKETCGGAPCQLAATLVSDAQDLTVHVIGFKVRGDHFSWGSQGQSDYTQSVSVARCLADATGGSYFSAETVGELANALATTLGCPSLSHRDHTPTKELG
jgi:Ca-activated chloride channel family protein